MVPSTKVLGYFQRNQPQAATATARSGTLMPVGLVKKCRFGRVLG
jgi:hypothetical protein